MKHNMGNADRIIRIAIALLIGILFFTDTITGPLAYVLLAVASIFLVTSVAGSCPLYSLLGIKTRGTKKNTQE